MKYSLTLGLNDGIFYIILSIPQNIVMDPNNVTMLSTSNIMFSVIWYFGEKRKV